MPTRRNAPRAVLVLLVRHGTAATTGKELPERGAGPSLSEQGRAQAQAVGELIAHWRASLFPLSHLYASPLARAQQTAAVLGEVLGLVPQLEPGLVDGDTGEWAGMELRKLSRQPGWPTVLHHPSAFHFPGGEAMLDMHARAVSTVRSLANKHPGESVVVVSHADPIKAVLADALGMHFDMFQRLFVAPGSLSSVLYTDEGPSVGAVNWLAGRDQLADLVPLAGRGRR